MKKLLQNKQKQLRNSASRLYRQSQQVTQRSAQPATLNCGVNGLTPSPSDVFAFLEDIKNRYKYAIRNAIRAFIVRILRDPTGSASDFQACLNEDERKALYVCINEKIQRALLRTIWDTNDLDGAGLLHAPLQHAINPADMSLTIKRATKYYVVWI